MKAAPFNISKPYSGLNRFFLPPGFLVLALGFFIIGGIGQNMLLAIAAIMVLLVGSRLLWRPGESPVLLFALAYPWTQASVSIFYANWSGIDIADFSPFAGEMHSAVLLSLAGVLVFAVGMRVGAGRWRPQDGQMLAQQGVQQPFIRWFRIYAYAWVLGFVASALASSVPGLSQPLLGLAAMKWAFFFILAYAVFIGVPGGKKLFAAVFLVELASGIGGLFSDFKTVFLVTGLAALASGVRFSPRALIGFGTFAAVLLALGVVWTAIKGDFRSFATGGEASQTISADYGARIEKLIELVGDLDSEKLEDGLDRLLRRLTYVEFFAAVLEVVPAEVPHENGAILWDAIERPFMPRLFFPDKAVIDDSSRTNYYTRGLAGDSQGTSISVGWVAEMYIDFGRFGMLVAILLIGVFFGCIYRGFLRWGRSRGLLGSALATAILVNTSALESSFTKTFGSIVCSMLVAWVLVRLIAPRWAPWLLMAPD